ncbi:conjugative transposon protein TraM [Pricia sp. S334]|uniref:Conjugative transposon protein TraM n=1 Tax=Pricia mediterranea TaxID=3076079 RepID=A0ABU3L4W4_9FLAO|nr:conjugative transposon protein TraM [Pricia sp. S334]MDT7828376.1 conjugative transposon protein TraM [Pricia sp. S334]
MDRNKIIFIGIIGIVATFIIAYAVFLMGNEDEVEADLKQPDVPELKEETKEYDSKLDAVNDLKEVRESNAPSIYDESLLDSSGTSLQETERQRIVDSIYRNGRIDYGAETNSGSGPPTNREGQEKNKSSKPDFSKSHNAFFDTPERPKSKAVNSKTNKTDALIMVEVNGEQTVRNGERLELRLAVDAIIKGDSISRNSLVYGFVSFKANRVFIRITNIDNNAVDLKAFDLMDGNEGIYIKNSVRAEATGEVLDDIIQDINIPGVPQIGGIKQVFRRNNRNVRATIYNQYQLILKPSL